MVSQEKCIPVLDCLDIGLDKTNAIVSAEDIKKIGEQLKDVFTSAGFCYLKNHGIDKVLIENYMTVSHSFFNQSVDVKQKHVRGTERNFGWVAVEMERLNPSRPGDLKEAFNYHPADDTGDWPDIEDFQKYSRLMFEACKSLTLRLCDCLSSGLGLNKSFMADAHKLIGSKGNPTTLRTLYYPPIAEDSQIKPGQIRLGEHSDYGTITLLFQDDVGGLEANIPGTGYVPVTPIPDTIVVNIGDLMQRWSVDALVATKHRVLIPEVELKKRKSRQSVVFFVHPDDEFVIKPLDGSDKYEPISSIDYLNERFSVTY